MLAVLYTSQILLFNRSIQGTGLESTVSARDARLNTAGDDRSDMDAGLGQQAKFMSGSRGGGGDETNPNGASSTRRVSLKECSAALDAL